MSPDVEMAFALVTALRAKSKEQGSPLTDMPLLRVFEMAELKGLDAMSRLGIAAELLDATGLCVLTITSVDERRQTKAEALSLSQRGYDATDGEVRLTLYPDAH